MQEYNAIIIGSGQAGTPLAFKLAGEGQKVAFIEKKNTWAAPASMWAAPLPKLT